VQRSAIWNRFCASIALAALFFPATGHAASLDPTTLKAWDEYVDFASKQVELRLGAGKTFLWVDETPDRLARVRAGEIAVSPVGQQNPKRVPLGLIHDWVGAAFIANVTLSDVLHILRDYPRYKDLYRPAVIDSRAIATGKAADRFSMLLVNKSWFMKTAFDTEYESCFVQVGEGRGYSVSHTTRVQEIDDYGAPGQRTLNEGEGKGIIWRLFSITRYAERDGGVYIELEAIGLSRDIPPSLHWLVEPIVRRISRGSLSTSLRQTEEAVQSQVELARGEAASAGLRASHLSQ